MPSPEQMMSASDLLDAYNAGRTQHMEQRPTGEVVKGVPVMVGVLVLDAQVERDGAWRYVQQVVSDDNDEAQPVFVDLLRGGQPDQTSRPGERQVYTMSDMINVRGLLDAA